MDATDRVDVQKQIERLSANRRDTDAASLGKATPALQSAWRQLVTSACATRP